MTREEAIAFFKDMNECTYGNLEAVDMAIKALEQQPCEDCISRQAVFDTTICDGIACDECSFNTCENGQSGCLLEERISKLPPVTPQPKTGYWNTYKITQGGIDEEWLECSECMWSNALLIPRNYCPNCGARMFNPQESEE